MKVVITREREAALPLVSYLNEANIAVDVVELARACAVPTVKLSLTPEDIVLISSSNALRFLDHGCVQSLIHAPHVLVVGPHTYARACEMGVSHAHFVGETHADLETYILTNVPRQKLTYICGSVTRLDTCALSDKGFEVCEHSVYSYETLPDADENMKTIDFCCPDVHVLVSSRAVSRLMCAYLENAQIPVRCTIMCNSLDVLKDFQSLGIFANMCKLWDYNNVLQKLQS